MKRKFSVGDIVRPPFGGEARYRIIEVLRDTDSASTYAYDTILTHYDTRLPVAYGDVRDFYFREQDLTLLGAQRRPRQRIGTNICLL